MQIKHIDIVLKITLRGFEGWEVLNLFVFIIIFFFESNDSAPWSILRKIFWNSLSTKIKKTLNAFLNPKVRIFIDLTETDLIRFCNSSCTKGIKRNAINNWKSHLLTGNPIFLNGCRNQPVSYTHLTLPTNREV